MCYIKDFVYHKMWDHYDIAWHNLHTDVNILVGINGTGKTTILDAINSYYNQKFPASFYKKYGSDRIIATPLNCPVIYIESYDVPAVVKRKGDSVLDNNLKKVVYQNESQNSFFNYRMRALNYPDERKHIDSQVETLFKEIDSYFNQNGKRIEIEKENNMLIFREKNEERIITLGMLSAGEKQLLLILLTVFLMDEQPAVLLMDEPELSLHIEWQEKLIKSIRRLNKNCQLIITTHSPSVFANGWEDRITFIEDLYENI